MRDTTGVRSPEILAPAAFTVLAGVCAINAAWSFDGWAHAAQSLTTAGVVIGAALAGILLYLLTGSTRGRSTGGRSVVVHGHAHTGHRASLHEAGHVAGARGVGGRVKSARVYRDGSGLVRAEVPDAKSAIVFLYAGQAAQGDPEGATGDDALIQRTLREFPRRDRSSVLADAQGEAHRIVRRDVRQIQRDKEKLDRRYRL
jgi:hypothetical protein